MTKVTIITIQISITGYEPVGGKIFMDVSIVCVEISVGNLRIVVSFPLAVSGFFSPEY